MLLRLKLFLLHLRRHRLIQLGKPLAQPRLRRHALEHAPTDAAVLASRERLGGEVIDAGCEAIVDEAAEELGGTSQGGFTLREWEGRGQRRSVHS